MISPESGTLKLSRTGFFTGQGRPGIETMRKPITDYTILGEIPLWIAVVMVGLFVAIWKLLYNPYA